MKSRKHKNAAERTRRALKKKAKREYKIMRGSSGDFVAIQIAAIVEKVPKGFRLTKSLLDEMIRHKAATSSGQWDGLKVAGAHEGENPPGIRLVILRWKNPDRLASEDAGWRYADPDSASEQADAWGSLRRIISASPLSIRISRDN